MIRKLGIQAAEPAPSWLTTRPGWIGQSAPVTGKGLIENIQLREKTIGDRLEVNEPTFSPSWAASTVFQGRHDRGEVRRCGGRKPRV